MLRAVTCDGTSTNISTMSKLGCQMSGVYSEIIEYFTIPGVEQKVDNLLIKILLLHIIICSIV